LGGSCAHYGVFDTFHLLVAELGHEPNWSEDALLETQGYGTWLLWVITMVGIFLLVWRPRWVVLLVVGLETALSVDRLTSTQLSPGNNPFNAHDVLLLLALVAVLATSYRKRQQTRVPLIVVGLLSVLLFGFLLSVIKIPGSTYDIMRMLRRGLTLPLYYFVGRNAFGDRETLNLLLWTVILAVLVGAGTHVLGSSVLLLEGYSLYSIRDIQYLGGLVPVLVVAIIARGTLWMDTRRKRLLAYLCVLMGLVSVVISLTRSLWIAVAMAIPLTWIVFRRPRTGPAKMHTNSHGLLILGLGVVAMVFLRLFSGNVLAELMGRLSSVGQLFQGSALASEFGDRLASFALDFAAWRQSPIVGQGLWYYLPLVGNTDYSAIGNAWGHLGYISTLAQLGLVGFGVFYVWLPVAVIKNATFLWVSTDSTARQLGLLGGAGMIMSLIEFLMSGNFISMSIAGPGLTWGVLAAYRALLQGEPARETAQ